jgi:hypothetical protein
MRLAVVMAGPDFDRLKVIGSTDNPKVVGLVAEVALADLPDVKDPDLRRLSGGRRSALRALVADGYKSE